MKHLVDEVARDKGKGWHGLLLWIHSGGSEFKTLGQMVEIEAPESIRIECETLKIFPELC